MRSWIIAKDNASSVELSSVDDKGFQAVVLDMQDSCLGKGSVVLLGHVEVENTIKTLQEVLRVWDNINRR